jgi:TatD DNase family protein
MSLCDTHAHLMDAAFADDLDAVLDRARAAGVTNMLLVGYDLPSSRSALELTRRLPGSRAAVGIHPNSSGQASSSDFDALADLARRPEVVAIGETGLDYYRDWTPPGRQREALEWHLRLALEVALPVVIHNRDADQDVADALESFAVRRYSATPPGVLHCFGSLDPTYLERMLAAGYFASFAGTVTFRSAEALREQARRVPLDRLLVETDCPYLAPVPHRGRRNEPAFVRDTAACLADLHGLSLEEMASAIERNTRQVFPAFAPRAVGSTA